jgi:CheY-like chemotaxis protein
MRTFGGDLGILGFENLLQMISLSEAKGFLMISQGELKKTIQFSTQGIRLFSGVKRVVPLGQILVRTGKMTAGQLNEILLEQCKTGQRLGELVVERGFMTQEDVDQALRDQVAEEIYELFAWPEAKFYFAEAEGDSLPTGAGPLSEVLLSADVISLMVEAARRSDEMARIRSEIPVDQLVPLRTDLELSPDDPGIDRDAAREIMFLADGTRSVEAIAQESSYPRFTVLHTLFGLKHRGVLAIGKPSAPERRPARPGVLLISRELAFRSASATSLRNGGYSVSESDTWDRAGATLRQNAIAAIILDISFDSEDAVSICERIREDSRKPFIVLTEKATGQAFEAALQSGARYVLLKPVDEKVLLDRLARLQ